jgi:transposase, IS5 family
MGVKQFGFGDYEQSTTKKRTRRERFLAEVEAVVSWKLLIDLIEPHRSCHLRVNCYIY